MAIDERTAAATYTPQPTLPGRDYYDPRVWNAEHESIFCGTWFCLGREEEVANPGDFLVREAGDESVVLARSKEGALRAFYNSCAHRGTRLCDERGNLKSGVIKCPYHAWTYDLDGNLVGTPNVHEEEGFDRSKYPLHQMRVQAWEGFVFVNMSQDPEDLLDMLADDPWDPFQFERYHIEDLRSGTQLVYEVEANWKILLENYNECLHCPSVHPELIQLIPIYKKGIVEQKEGWAGNSMAEGAVTLTSSGTSNRPTFPDLDELDEHTYYGTHVFPNLLLNMHSDCVMYYLLLPRTPTHTTVISDFLFEPGTIAASDFDPADIREFWDMVSRQDWAICEREQIGVRSRAYRDGGVYPLNDRLLATFNQHYLAVRGPVPD